MAFEHSPANPSDIPEMVAVAIAAFRSDPIFDLMKRDSSATNITIYNIETYTQSFNTPGVRHFKIVDTDNRNIVAFCKWRFPHEAELAQKSTAKPKISMPEGFNEALHEEFIDKLSTSRQKHLNGREDYFVHMLATHPSYQRRGLGRMLLKHGLRLAEMNGAKVYLEASQTGLPLYLSLGWQEVGEFSIDLHPYGGSTLEVIKCLVRRPRE